MFIRAHLMATITSLELAQQAAPLLLLLAVDGRALMLQQPG